jgi:hypothetical protein
MSGLATTTLHHQLSENFGFDFLGTAGYFWQLRAATSDTINTVTSDDAADTTPDTTGDATTTAFRFCLDTLSFL